MQVVESEPLTILNLSPPPFAAVMLIVSDKAGRIEWLPPFSCQRGKNKIRWPRVRRPFMPLAEAARREPDAANTAVRRTRLRFPVFALRPSFGSSNPSPFRPDVGRFRMLQWGSAKSGPGSTAQRSRNENREPQDPYLTSTDTSQPYGCE